MCKFLKVLQNFMWMSSACLMISVFSEVSRGSLEVFKDDLELSRKCPIISGFKKNADEIIKGKKAAMTLCTLPMKWTFMDIEHVALVFEVKHPKEERINLLSVQFCGEGGQFQKGALVVEGSYDTLRKFHSGKKVSILDDEVTTERSHYDRRITFLVDAQDAINAIKMIEMDGKRDLQYSIKGHFCQVREEYNCCTYVDKCLKEANVLTGFNESCWLKRASNLIDRCEHYTLQPGQEKRSFSSQKLKLKEGENY